MSGRFYLARQGERDPQFTESSWPLVLGFRPFRLCRGFGDRDCDDSSSLNVDGVQPSTNVGAPPTAVMASFPPVVFSSLGRVPIWGNWGCVRAFAIVAPCRGPVSTSWHSGKPRFPSGCSPRDTGGRNAPARSSGASWGHYHIKHRFERCINTRDIHFELR